MIKVQFSIRLRKTVQLCGPSSTSGGIRHGCDRSSENSVEQSLRPTAARRLLADARRHSDADLLGVRPRRRRSVMLTPFSKRPLRPWHEAMGSYLNS